MDTQAVEALAAEWLGRGASVLGLAVAGRLVAAFAVQDALKPGALTVVQQLQARGLKLHLVSGDHPQAAAEIARQVGLAPEQVFAEVRPEQKASLVQQLQARAKPTPVATTAIRATQM